MSKRIDGDLVLEADRRFSESIEVTGDIRCENGMHDLTVEGSIEAWNIEACDIDACDIDAGNIDACDIDACDIDARNISYFCFCISRKSINITGIKGRRQNSLHEAIDGEITVNDKHADSCIDEVRSE